MALTDARKQAIAKQVAEMYYEQFGEDVCNEIISMSDHGQIDDLNNDELFEALPALEQAVFELIAKALVTNDLTIIGLGE